MSDGGVIKMKDNKTLNEYIQEINAKLLEEPTALNISLKKKEDGSHFYSWDNTSLKAINTRRAIRKILSSLWQSGAYNYDKIADALRVDVLSIQGLIDESFLLDNPHITK